MPFLGAALATGAAVRHTKVLSCEIASPTKSLSISQDKSMVKEEAKKNQVAFILTLVKAKLGIVYNHLHNSSELQNYFNQGKEIYQ